MGTVEKHHRQSKNSHGQHHQTTEDCQTQKQTHYI